MKAVILFLFLALLSGCEDKVAQPDRFFVMFSYYDPTLPEPERWETKNLLVHVGFDASEYLSFHEGAMDQIKKVERQGLFRWPIILSDGSEAWSLRDLDQVREQ